jgi:hypothetical protein
MTRAVNEMRREDKIAEALRRAGVHAGVTWYRDDEVDGSIELLPCADGAEMHVQVGDSHMCLALWNDGVCILFKESRSIADLSALIKKVQSGT